MSNGPFVHATVSACRARGVLVRVSGRDSKGDKSSRLPFFSAESGRTSVSCSGVLWDHERGIIVTSGSAIVPFLASFDGHSLGAVLEDGVEISAMLPCGGSGWRCATLLHIFDVPSVSTALRDLIHGNPTVWRCGWPMRHTSVPRESHRVAATIAVLRVQSDAAPRGVCVGHVGVCGPDGLALGDPLLTVSSPFGLLSPQAFTNSVACGVLSNVLGSNALILTDAPCLPGSDGGGVWDADGHLVGLLLPPLYRTDLLPVELHTVAPAHILHHHVSKCDVSRTIGVACAPTPSLRASNVSRAAGVRRAAQAVVPVSTPSTWGSAVPIAKDVLLTNAHVVRSLVAEGSPSMHPKLCPGARVSVAGHRSVEIVFISSGWMDVAVLRDPHGDYNPLRACTSDPTEGEAVAVLGFPVFVPSAATGASCTSGIVSKVVSVQRGSGECIPVVLQTCAAVHGGNSGGAVVNRRGELLGLVTVNMKQSGRDVLPRMNFSIPAKALRCAFEYARTKDARVLSGLEEHDEEADKLWRLTPDASKPNPSTTKWLQRLPHLNQSKL